MEKTVTINIKPEDSKAIFDCKSEQWFGVLDYNRMFLKAQEIYFNAALKTRGHVFLNEVLDALGLKRTRNGAILGWVNKSGCEFISFDAKEIKQDCFELSFNVDGVILDLI